jgi:phage terminase large subunit-like protein
MSSPAVEVAFVDEWADLAVNFFERVLVHTKGRYARVPFILAPWQRDDIIRPLFGTARWDPQFGEWVRLYNEAWLELGRKNGKSEKLAGIGLKLLVADDEEAAEIYGAAKDRDQAGLVFNVAARMVRLSPLLDRRLKIIDSRKTIVDPITDSIYRVVAADADGNLGQDPSGIIFDEIISQPSRELYDTFRTSFGSGSRRQPLLVAATTAGNDPEGFAAHEHQVAIGIAEDPAKAPNRFVYIRNTPEDADPWLEKNWHHANPALGDFLSLERLRQEAREAQSDLLKENSFRQYRLNQWVQQTTRAIRLSDWDKCGTMLGEPDELIGRPVYAGLDLAATSDLAALKLVFPPLPAEADLDDEADVEPLRIVSRYFMPQALIPELDKQTGGKISVWVRQGFIKATPGDVIDYDAIHDELAAAATRYNLLDVSIDIWNSTATSNWCAANGITAVPVSQTFRALSPPTKELLRLIKSAGISHNGNPVDRWNIDAVELKRDYSDNVRPVKPDRNKSGKRIDGFVALILAVDGYLRRGTGRRSAYEDGDVEVV